MFNEKTIIFSLSKLGYNNFLLPSVLKKNILCVCVARCIPGLMTRSHVDGGWPRFAWSKERQVSTHSLSKPNEPIQYAVESRR